MFRSLRIGRLYGIDVNVHPSFLLVFVWTYVQWGRDGGGGLQSLLLGCILVLFIFLSVLIHELGHCAMALQFGNRVLDITLWPFGGVARIEDIPAQPKGEILISLAGPAMNLAIAVALAPVVALLGVLHGRNSLLAGSGLFDAIDPGGVIVYLALVNIIIMLFNLLPAFPMDGGRVLRAALTPALGRERATSVAVSIGTVLAIGMVLAGLWQQAWSLVVVGLFVLIAAHVEGRAVRVESAMRRLKVGQFALWDMGGISPHHPLTFALRGGPRDLVVTDEGRVVGMLWRSQLLDGLNGGVAGRTVADIMDQSVYVADIDDSVFDVQLHMNRMSRWAVPVTEDGLYRGIFTADRFVHLYRQIAPGVTGMQISIPEEWRQAIAHNFRSMQRPR